MALFFRTFPPHSSAKHYMTSGPDILYDPPLLLPDAPKDKALREALTFGFARGADRDRLLHVSEPPIEATSFDPKVFGEDLFLQELVERCFRVVVRNKSVDAPSRFFLRVLSSPPKQKSSVDFRYEIHDELSSEPERLKWLEGAYLALVDFRDSLCGSDFNQRSIGVRRRIDILAGYKKALDALFRACATSESGLRRIADWVEEVQKKDSYRALVQLLDFEDGRSVLETRLQAGYDGTLRRFEIVRVSNVEHKAFPRGPFTRFLTSLVSLLKGYRFSEEDVMSQVLDDVFGQLEGEVALALGLMQQIEFYLRSSFFRNKARGAGLYTCRPSASQGQGRVLIGLFNPWLLAQSKSPPVPCDLELDDDESIVIVTGPNSGGKTRLLQSLAISQLLYQAGLPVPCRSAQLDWVEQLFLSMIEHAEADQAEGRLGLELMRIRQVFESSGARSLILMDELCSGTNPSEGERIFEMVLDLLQELGAQVWITTHFLDFASRMRDKAESVGGKGETLEATSCLTFLQVELDAQKRPTYQFRPGVAGTSLARNTAARLGVTREELRSLIAAHEDQRRSVEEEEKAQALSLTGPSVH